MPSLEKFKGYMKKKKEDMSDSIADKRRSFKKHIGTSASKQRAKQKEAERESDLISSFQEMHMADIFGLTEEELSQVNGGEEAQGSGTDEVFDQLEDMNVDKLLDIASTTADFGPDGLGAGPAFLSTIKDIHEAKSAFQDMMSRDTEFESTGRKFEKGLRYTSAVTQAGADALGMVPGADIGSSGMQIAASAQHAGAETAALAENRKDFKRISNLENTADYAKNDRGLAFAKARTKSDSIQSGKELTKDLTTIATSAGAIAADAGAAPESGKIIKAGQTGFNFLADLAGNRAQKRFDRNSEKEIVGQALQEKTGMTGTFSQIRDQGRKGALGKSTHKHYTKKETEKAMGLVTTGHSNGLKSMADTLRTKEVLKLSNSQSPEAEHNIAKLEAMGFVNIREIQKKIDEKNAHLPADRQIPSTMKFPSNYAIAKKMGFKGSEDDFKSLLVPISELRRSEVR